MISEVARFLLPTTDLFTHERLADKKDTVDLSCAKTSALRDCKQCVGAAFMSARVVGHVRLEAPDYLLPDVLSCNNCKYIAETAVAISKQTV